MVAFGGIVDLVTGMVVGVKMGYLVEERTGGGGWMVEEWEKGMMISGPEEFV